MASKTKNREQTYYVGGEGRGKRRKEGRKEGKEIKETLFSPFHRSHAFLVHVMAAIYGTRCHKWREAYLESTESKTKGSPEY